MISFIFIFTYLRKIYFLIQAPREKISLGGAWLISNKKGPKACETTLQLHHTGWGLLNKLKNNSTNLGPAVLAHMGSKSITTYLTQKPIDYTFSLDYTTWAKKPNKTPQKNKSKKAHFTHDGDWRKTKGPFGSDDGKIEG